MNEMFCFQCEQTAMCKGCTGRAGVCGKPADTAKLQDKLTGALIGLSRAVKISKVNTASTDKALLAGLFTTITNASFSNDAINAIIDQVHAEINKIAPHDHVIDYDVDKIWQDNEDIRSLKSLILFGLRGMAAYAYHAMMLKYTDKEVNSFFYEALFMLGEDADMNTLLPMVLKTGEVNLKCMALLDKANTTTYGTPVPTTVPLTIEKGPSSLSQVMI